MIMLNGMSNLKFEAQIYQIPKTSYIILFIYFMFEWYYIYYKLIKNNNQQFNLLIIFQRCKFGMKLF